MFKGLRNLFKGASKEVWEVAKQATGEAIGKAASEASKVVVEKITIDPHGELLTEIKKLLDEECRKIMFKRLLKHSREHRENRTANLLIKIPGGERKEVFEWLCWLNDEQFEQVLDLLENNRVEEFFARQSEWVSTVYTEKIVPLALDIFKAAEDFSNEIDKKLEPTLEKFEKRAAKKGVKSWLDF